jgi:hypothetical protein
MNILFKQHLAQLGDKVRDWPIGSYRGFTMTLSAVRGAFPELLLSSRTTHGIEFKAIAAGALLNRADSLIDALPFKAEAERGKARTKASQLEGYTGRVGLPFERDDRLRRLHEIRAELETLLSGAEGRERIDGLVAEYDAIKGGAVIEHQPELEIETETVAEPTITEEPEREGAVIIPFIPAPPQRDRVLIDVWKQKSLFEVTKPARQKKFEPIKWTVGRPVQLSLF